MFKSIKPLVVASFIFTPAALSAEEVKLDYQGITLNANLQLAEEDAPETIFLITHGTLAHNGMEIITAWQELLLDEGISSLAINLSLGINDRHGMYDCQAPHNHKHSDAAKEIAAWVNWLQKQGHDNIILAAHSRGGNQTAWYSTEHHDDAVKGQVLLAPQTWSKQYELDNYEQRYKQALTPLLQKAKQLPPDEMMTATDFIYCENTSVTAASFVSYYQPDSKFDTPTLLQSASLPTLVIAGSEDSTVPGLADKMAKAENSQVKTVEIEGAGHFFRDLYMDEVIEHTLEFADNL